MITTNIESLARQFLYRHRDQPIFLRQPREAALISPRRQPTIPDVPLMEALLRTLGEAFDDLETYTANPPNAGYLRRLLGGDSFIALAALKSGAVVGGIAAYELKIFRTRA